MRLAGSEGSIKTLNDRAVDGKAGAPKCLTARPRKELVLHEGENLEFFTQLPSETLVDGVLVLLVQIGVPRRAVI